jgi:hypothetical protein
MVTFFSATLQNGLQQFIEAKNRHIKNNCEIMEKNMTCDDGGAFKECKS